MEWYRPDPRALHSAWWIGLVLAIFGHQVGVRAAGVDPPGVPNGGTYTFAYPNPIQRTVTGPDGVERTYALTGYGAVAQVAVAADVEQTTEWADADADPTEPDAPPVRATERSAGGNTVTVTAFEDADTVLRATATTTTLASADGLPADSFDHTRTYEPELGLITSATGPRQGGSGATVTQTFGYTVSGHPTQQQTVDDTPVDVGAGPIASLTRTQTRGGGFGRLQTDARLDGTTGTYVAGAGPFEQSGRIARAAPPGVSQGLATYAVDYEYDDLGRLTARVDHDLGLREEFEWDLLGRQVRHRQLDAANGNAVLSDRRTSYTPQRAEVWGTLNGGDVRLVARDYDADGVLIGTAHRFGPAAGQSADAETEYSYAAGRLEQAAIDLGVGEGARTREQTYTPAGRPETTTVKQGGALLRRETLAYDATGSRVTQVTHQTPGAFAYTTTLDALGRARQVNLGDPAHDVSFERDFFGNVLERKAGADGNEDRTASLTGYDPFGRPVSSSAQAEADVQSVLTRTPDAAGRPTRIAGVHDEDVQTLEYTDAKGRPTRRVRTVKTREVGTALLADAVETTTWDYSVPRQSTALTVWTVGLDEVDRVTVVTRTDALGRMVFQSRSQPDGLPAEETTQGYDQLGHLAWRAVEGPWADRCTRMEHDPRGNLLRACTVRDEAGGCGVLDPVDASCDLLVLATYDALGQRRTLSQRGLDGETWTESYDVRGRRTARCWAAVPAADGCWTWTHADLANGGRSESETPPAGLGLRPTVRTYDVQGRLVQEEAEVLNGENEVRKVDLTYAGDRLRQRVDTFAAATATTLYTYDPKGRPVQVSQSFDDGDQSNLAYGATWIWNDGPLTTVSRTTTAALELNGLANPVNASRVEALVLDGRGEVLERQWQGSDVIDRWWLDGAGRLLATQPHAQAQRTYGWDAGHLATESVVGFPDQTTTHHYAAGAVQVERPGGVTEHSLLDGLGTVRHHVQAVGHEWTVSTFDAAGRLTDRTLPINQGPLPGVAIGLPDPLPTAPTWQYEHGPFGMTSARTPDLELWAYDRRADGQLARITPPAGLPERTFTFDGLGRMTGAQQVLDGNLVLQQTTTWAGLVSTHTQRDVDGAGSDVVSVRRASPWGPVYRETWTRTAGHAGDLTARTQAFTLDGRLLGAEEALVGGETVTYAQTYDGAGRLTHEASRGDTVTYTYGVANNPRQMTVQRPGALGLETRTFDGLGRLVSLDDGRGPVALGYDALGQITSLAGLGLTETRTYDADAPRRLERITLTPDTGAAVTYDYAYEVNAAHGGFNDWADPPALSITRTEGGAAETTRHWFDPQWRLAAVEYPALASGAPARRHRYTLRPDGARAAERVTQTDGAFVQETAYEYGAFGQLDRTVELDAAGAEVPGTAVDVLTDGLGRVTYARTGGSEREYTWDVLGRMLELRHLAGQAGAGSPAVAVSQFRYNLRDQRVRRVANGQFERTVWDGQGVLARSVTGFDPATESFGLPPAAGAWQPTLRAGELVVADGGTRFGHDHLGSPVLAVDVAGVAPPLATRFDAWGAYRDGGPPAGLGGVGFTGHWAESDGLVYAEARWLDPALGAFLSPDPWAGDLADPRSLGRFHYAAGNPVVFTDPDGRQRRDDVLLQRHFRVPDEVPTLRRGLVFRGFSSKELDLVTRASRMLRDTLAFVLRGLSSESPELLALVRKHFGSTSIRVVDVLRQQVSNVERRLITSAVTTFVDRGTDGGSCRDGANGDGAVGYENFRGITLCPTVFQYYSEALEKQRGAAAIVRTATPQKRARNGFSHVVETANVPAVYVIAATLYHELTHRVAETFDKYFGYDDFPPLRMGASTYIGYNLFHLRDKLHTATVHQEFIQAVMRLVYGGSQSGAHP